MSSHTYDIRDIPVLTEAVDLAGLLAAPQPTQPVEPVEPAEPVAPAPDAAALQSAIVADALKIAASLTGEAARDIEALLYERVVGQLRAQLPELVERIVREHLRTSPPEPGEPDG